MTTARGLIDRCRAAGSHWQLEVNEFVDGFRRASDAERAAMIALGPLRTAKGWSRRS